MTIQLSSSVLNAGFADAPYARAMAELQRVVLTSDNPTRVFNAAYEAKQALAVAAVEVAKALEAVMEIAEREAGETIPARRAELVRTCFEIAASRRPQLVRQGSACSS